MGITIIAPAATPEQIRKRQELRRSNAAQRHANAAKVGERRQRARADARRAAIREAS